MAARRKPLFRGGTPRNVIQTLDIGAGNAQHMVKQARRFSNRHYAAVEPHPHFPATIPANFTSYRDIAEKILPRLVRQRMRVRHINIDMPYPTLSPSEFMAYTAERITKKFTEHMSHILRIAPKLLLPNGKIFLSTEREDFVTVARTLAESNGFSVRVKRNMPRRQALSRTLVTRRVADQPIYRLEITFPLTMVRSKRKKGPHA